MSKWGLAIICGTLLSCAGPQEGPEEAQAKDSRKPVLQITEEAERTTALGDKIKYALQLPPVEKQTSAKWPIVVLFHGFSRDHSRQVGTGRIIADRGLLVLVPDMTTLMTGEKGRRKNVEVLADHLEWLSKRNSDESDPLFDRLDMNKIGVTGHSAGGGIALEYAVGEITNTPLKPVTAVALLDGVPWKNTIKRIEAGNCEAPLISIRADKSAWNANWSVLEAESAWKGDVIAVHLKGTSHIDPENPPEKLGNIVMRASKPERRLVFAELVAEFFRARLLGQSSEFENKLKQLEENGDTVTKSDR